MVTTPDGYAAFVPAPLPPHRLMFGRELVLALSRADAALGELSGIVSELPEPHLLDAPFKRQEALCSSRIEGAHVSLSDLLLDQIGAAPAGVPRDHLREVRACIATLRFGVERLADEPLSLDLVRRLHEELLRGEIGGNRTPGEFRTGAELARTARLHLGDRRLRRPAGARDARGPRRLGRVPARRATSCPTWCSVRCCTPSSRPSTRSWAATAVSAACSSRSS